MSSVRVTNHIPDFNAALAKALPKAVANMAEVYVSAAARSMQRTGGRAGVGKGVAYNNPSAPGTPPAVQTGFLRRSITRSNPVNLTAKVGTAYSVGKYMEFGANPHAKGKKLAVPLTREAARSTGPRAFGDLDLIVTKNKKVLLGRSKGKGGFEALFVLVDSVHIAPRPWLRPAMRNRDNARRAEAVMAQTVKREVLAAARAGAA